MLLVMISMLRAAGWHQRENDWISVSNIPANRNPRHFWCMRCCELKGPCAGTYSWWVNFDYWLPNVKPISWWNDWFCCRLKLDWCCWLWGYLAQPQCKYSRWTSESLTGEVNDILLLQSRENVISGVNVTLTWQGHFDHVNKPVRVFVLLVSLHRCCRLARLKTCPIRAVIVISQTTYQLTNISKWKPHSRYHSRRDEVMN